MKKIIIPLLIFVVGVSALIALIPQPQIRQAHATTTTQTLHQNDSVIVPLANLIITNFTYDPNRAFANELGGFQELLRFTFSGATGTAEIEFTRSGTRNHFDGGRLSWMYEILCNHNSCAGKFSCEVCNSFSSDCWYCGDIENTGCHCNILVFTNTANGLVITVNPNTQLNFTHVTIATYWSTVNITAGEFVPTEFIVIFMDIEGNVIAVVNTVDRHIPVELIPVPSQIDFRPFIRWLNIQGYLVDEIITSDIVFLPFHGFDFNYRVEDSTNEEQNTSSDELDIAVVGLIVIAFVVVLIILRRK